MRSRWTWISGAVALVAAFACISVLVGRNSGGSDETPAGAPVVTVVGAPGSSERSPGTAPSQEPAGTGTSAPVMSDADRALIAKYGATFTDGPRIAAEGDPGATDTFPTANELGLLSAIPADWGVAMSTAARAAEGIASTDTARGAFLAQNAASELYLAWSATLDSDSPRGTFSIQSFALAALPEDRAAPLTFIGTGTFTQAASGATTPFVVSATVTRTPAGWRLTSATFDALEGVN